MPGSWFVGAERFDLSTVIIIIIIPCKPYLSASAPHTLRFEYSEQVVKLYDACC
jgi:hypothetical protein